MYRTILKSKGQLPSGSLVTKIFEHLKINIPTKINAKSLLVIIVGERMITKMRFGYTEEGWTNNKGQLVKVQLTHTEIMDGMDKSSKKRKGKSSIFEA